MIAHNPQGFLNDSRSIILEYVFGFLTYIEPEKTKEFTEWAVSYWHVGDMIGYHRELNKFIAEAGYKDLVDEIEQGITKVYAQAFKRFSNKSN